MSLFDGKDISQAITFSARGPDIAIIGFFLRWKCQRLGESENEKTKKWEGPEEAERRGSVSTKTPLKKKKKKVSGKPSQLSLFASVYKEKFNIGVTQKNCPNQEKSLMWSCFNGSPSTSNFKESRKTKRLKTNSTKGAGFPQRSAQNLNPTQSEGIPPGKCPNSP